jgi:hypothetical protein
MTQPPDDHLKALWQGQETETKPMSVEAIRARAAWATVRTRWALVLGVVLMLAQVVIFGRFALILPGTAARVGMLAILVGLGWMIARYSLLAPGKFPGAKASGETILEYHRTELQRHSASFRTLMVMVGPLMLGMVIFLAGLVITRPRLAMQTIPVWVLMGLWLVGAWWFTRWAEKKRLRKLGEIEATRVE